MKRNATQSAVLCLLASAVLASGCAYFKREPKVETEQKTVRKPGQEKVVVDGQAMVFGHPNPDTQSVPRFVEQTRSLLSTDPAAARTWVHDHPDLALEALRNANSGDFREQTFQQIAYYHDEQCNFGNGQTGWTQLAQDRASQPQKFQAYDEARMRTMALLKRGEFERASQTQLLPLAEQTGSSLLRIDACWLTGIAQLVNDQPQQAVLSLNQTVELARQSQPYQATQALLLKSEAQRRAGQTAEANRTWQTASIMASNLLLGSIPIGDPTLWDRISYLHPVGEPWPQQIQQHLTQLCSTDGALSSVPATQTIVLCSHNSSQTLPTEASLWSAIGDWRLQRGENQEALVAYKRAETATSHTESKQWLRLAQATALIRLEQNNAATTLLAGLSGQSPDAAVSHAALATLGSLRLQSGMTQQGLVMLRRALKEHPDSEWPTRAEAEADLGLAYLMAGDEASGLRWLHQGQSRFAAEGKQRLLGQSLQNEIKYYEHLKDDERADAARGRLAVLPGPAGDVR